MITRRRFLEDSLLAAAALAGTPALALATRSGQPEAGPGRPIRVGVIGVRGRGRAHIQEFKDSPDAEVVAICDPDEAVIGPAMEAVPEATYYKDIRKLLEDDRVEAVSIATPNHWHTLASLWALRAGRHVYVEKPVSHNFEEGRALIKRANRSGLVVQHGTQARSHIATRDAIDWLHAGGLGRVRIARGLCYKRRESIGKVEGPIQPPQTLDYDLWTGPARMGPLMRENLHYDWHWDFNTGNGDIGNQGVHQMDIARWGLGKAGFPRRVTSCGGRLGYDDDGDTPNTQIAVYDYDDVQIIFEVRGLSTDAYKDTRIGVVFHCDEGYLVSSSYAKVVAFDLDGAEIKVFEGGGNHVQNFLDAIKRGDPSLCTGSPLDAHVSTGLCHLGNISYKLGAPRTLASDDAPFGRLDAANESFERFREHLVSNGLDAGTTEYRMGPTLAFNGSRERFMALRADEANELLGREPRESYSSPELM